MSLMVMWKLQSWIHIAGVGVRQSSGGKVSAASRNEIIMHEWLRNWAHGEEGEPQQEMPRARRPN